LVKKLGNFFVFRKYFHPSFGIIVEMLGNKIAIKHENLVSKGNVAVTLRAPRRYLPRYLN
jgi:hypothetical protein